MFFAAAPARPSPCHGQLRSGVQVPSQVHENGRVDFARCTLLPFLVASSFAARAIHRVAFTGAVGRAVMFASPRTELLVDGDSFSIGDIKRAIYLLKQQGRQVQTKVFTWPRRTDNKKWAQFLKEPNISFQPVPRSAGRSHEPTDQAIISAMSQVSSRRDVGCIALLTSDGDFISTMIDLRSAGANFLVVVPRFKESTVARYASQGFQVLILEPAGKSTDPRVRAILHSDGTGSVQLADPYKSFENVQGSRAVRSFLADLGYACQERVSHIRDFLTPACAKFWFANDLGSLTVFPSQPATLAVQDVMTQHAKAGCWAQYLEDFAFVLPCSTRHRHGLEKYGNSIARGVYAGSGPFILKDSSQTTSLVLRRLGYLDDGLNADESEAVLSFINATKNKVQLRKMQLLPKPSDNINQAKGKLRAAFLSHACKGLWHIPGDRTKDVTVILRKAGILSKPGGQYSRNELLDAMRLYARKKGLRPMQTFNGNARSILRVDRADPSQRDEIRFGRFNTEPPCNCG